MTFPNYQEFLEEIVYQLKDKVNGQIELRHNKYGELMYRYDIMVKFNCNLIICISCDLDSEIHKLYCNYKYTPEMPKYTTQAGAMYVFEFIKKAVFNYFFNSLDNHN